MSNINITPIGYVSSPFKQKFAIPRQSGLSSVLSVIRFNSEFHGREAFRGLEGYSRIWILWLFSENADRGWSPTVRPPVLGGNKRIGVFASRSPFRPNPVGLSAARLEKIEFDRDKGPLLYVRGADIADGTPVIDIKPYLPYADAFPEERTLFPPPTEKKLTVHFPEKFIRIIPEEMREPLIQALECDPRPAYREDGERIYSFFFDKFEISFSVRSGELFVEKAQEIPKGQA